MNPKTPTFSILATHFLIISIFPIGLYAVLISSNDVMADMYARSFGVVGCKQR